MNLTPESPRRSPIQAPRDSPATLGLSGPSQTPRVRLSWACGTETRPSTGSPALPQPVPANTTRHSCQAQGRAQQTPHSGGSEPQTRHPAAQGCLRCPASLPGSSSWDNGVSILPNSSHACAPAGEGWQAGVGLQGRGHRRMAVGGGGILGPPTHLVWTVMGAIMHPMEGHCHPLGTGIVKCMHE